MVRLVPVLRQGWWAISHACLLHSGLGFGPLLGLGLKALGLGLPGMDAMLFFLHPSIFGVT